VRWHNSWRPEILAFGLLCALVGFVIGLLIFGAPWHLPPAWGDIPTWLTAAFTGLLAVFAIITAHYAREAFRQQSVEVSKLLEERKREAAERRRAQASMVFVWHVRSTIQQIGQPAVDRVTMHLRNTSDQPIYDVRFSWPGLDGGLTIRDQPLMPDDEDADFRVAEVDAPTPACAVLFHDRNDVWWRVHTGGKLIDRGQHKSPPDW
jgi:hypothetical protein